MFTFFVFRHTDKTSTDVFSSFAASDGISNGLDCIALSLLSKILTKKNPPDLSVWRTLYLVCLIKKQFPPLDELMAILGYFFSFSKVYFHFFKNTYSFSQKAAWDIGVINRPVDTRSTSQGSLYASPLGSFSYTRSLCRCLPGAPGSSQMQYRYSRSQ